jgi:hypothetical protein
LSNKLAMKLQLLGSVLAVICLVGCGKSKSDAPPAPAAAPKSASIEADPGAAPPPPPTAATTADSPAAEGTGEVTAPGLEEINRALNAYTMGQMKEPSTLEDLVKAGFIKKLPTPPPGKRFALNANRTAVVVVDK